MKKKLIVLSLLFYVVIFAGCKNTNEHKNETDTIPEYIEEITPTQEASSSITPQMQLEIITANKNVWASTMDYANDVYHYAVTDLDQNGRLELIASNQGGTGNYTYTTFYEINETYDGLTLIKRDIQEGDSEVDIAADSVPAYYDASSKVIYYIFQDFMKDGPAAYYEDKRALSLESGQLKEVLLASKYTEYKEDGVQNIWKDANQIEITEEEYNTIEDSFFSALEKKTATFHWCQFFQAEELSNLSQEELLDLLTVSYEGFSIH